MCVHARYGQSVSSCGLELFGKCSCEAGLSLEMGKLVMACVTTVCSVVRFNGVMLDTFQSTRRRYANKVILCCLTYSCLLLMVCPKCCSCRLQENVYMAYKCAEGHRLCPTCCLQMIACCSSALMGHKRWQSSVDLPGTTRALVMMDCKFLKVPFF